MTVPPLEPGQGYRPGGLFTRTRGSVRPWTTIYREHGTKGYTLTHHPPSSTPKKYSYKTRRHAVKRFKKLCGETT